MGLTRLIEIEDLQVEFTTPQGIVKDVDDLNYHIEPGETLSCPSFGELAEPIVYSPNFPHPEFPFPNGVQEFLKTLIKTS